MAGSNRSSKSSWLEGPGDLKEDTVEDVPVKGESVLVRGLPAAYSNDAHSSAVDLVNLPNGEQMAKVNKGKMEVVQFHRGVIEPQFTIKEAEQVAERFGPAFNKVIAAIDELSGVNKEAIEDASARFPAGGSSENGAEAKVADGPAAGRSQPPVPSGTGA